ncbi:thioester domain-containing protein [Arthrobacter citreus]|uniref:thioester domain-containing protein n=1 Tax=Arthrobacter citreus TaxID=1670 RepID=UPI00382C10A5
MSLRLPPVESAVPKRGRPSLPRASGGTGVVGVLVFLLLLLQFAMPAQAVFSGESPGEELPSDITEITMTGTGAGQGVAGGLPPVGTPFDPTTGYPADVPAGYEPANEGFAGIITTVDAVGNTQQMYCIDIRTSTYTGLGYESGTWDESNVPNIGYVNRVLNSYYPDQPGLPDAPSDNIRAAAVQAAVWFFSDGYVLEDTDSVRPYTAAIVAAVLAAGPLTEPPAPNVSIDPPTAAGPTDGVTGPFTITSDAGTVTVAVPAGYTLYTDPAGTVPLTGTTVTSGTQLWVRNDNQTTDPVVLTATAVVPVQTGNVYLYAGNNPQVTTAQKLILAADAQIESNAQATAEFFVAGDLTVSKAFAGEGAGLQGDISLVVDCGASGVFTFDIPAGTNTAVTETVAGLPVGTVCSVTEPVTGSTTAVTVTPVLPEPVTITDGENLLAVTNTVDLNPGSLLVTKTITGTGAGLQDDIVIHVQCGEGIVDEVFVLAAGTTAGEYTQLYEGIPAGTLCNISEPTSGANEDVTVESTFTGEVAILPGATQATGVTNLYAPVPVTQRLPKTGAESLSLALMGGGAVIAGSSLVLASLRRRQG